MRGLEFWSEIFSITQRGVKKCLSVFLFLGIIILYACKIGNGENITVSGRIANIPDGKIYLADAFNNERILDSSIIQNGNFTFSLVVDSSFVPLMVSVYFKDKADKISPLIISIDENFIQFETAFYLEKGLISLSGDMNSPKKVQISAGHETKLMFTYRDAFGYLSKNESDLSRKNIILNYQKIIKKYPTSYFLLQSLAKYRTSYTTTEITFLFDVFSDELKSSYIGNLILAYILIGEVKSGEIIPSLSVFDVNNKTVPLLYSEAKINMLVFWASWCLPCRKEIPILKKLNNEFGDKGLKIKSISLDKDINQWKKAISETNMDWEQYRMSDSLSILTQSIFKYSSIPTIVFANSKQIKIASFQDYKEDSIYYYCKNIILREIK